MPNSKIIYGGETLIDLTSDTVTAETLEDGVTAHAANGARIMGTGLPGRVRFDVAQSLTDAEKSQARKNIGVNDAIGTMYKGAWIATECTGISQTYTETIVLPAGTYLVSVVAPYCADLTARVCISFSAKMAMGSGATFIDAAYGCVTMLATFTAQTNLRVLSAASANSATWSYLDRGGIAAVRVG